MEELTGYWPLVGPDLPATLAGSPEEMVKTIRQMRQTLEQVEWWDEAGLDMLVEPATFLAIHAYLGGCFAVQGQSVDRQDVMVFGFRVIPDKHIPEGSYLLAPKGCV
jgi:hypothetical protein